MLVTNMRNFPLSRGTVAGLLKGYIGISAAVYTAIYSMILDKSASKLLLFLTLGLPAICLVMMYFIRHCTPASGEDSSIHVHFLFTQAASIILAVYILVVTTVYDMVSFGKTLAYIFIAIMVILMASPLAIPVKMTFLPTDFKKFGPQVASSDNLAEAESDSTPAEPLLLGSSSSAAHLGSFHESEDVQDVGFLIAMGEGAVKKKRRPRRGEEFKFHEAFIKADFWLLWLVYFFGVGSGVTVLNNLAQIGTASGVNDTTILLCIFSFCNFLGRLGGGVISEHFVRY